MSQLFNDIMDGLEYIATYYGNKDLADEIKNEKLKLVEEELDQDNKNKK